MLVNLGVDNQTIIFQFIVRDTEQGNITKFEETLITFCEWSQIERMQNETNQNVEEY